MATSLIHDLNSSRNDWKIKVRVSRLIDVVNFRKQNSLISLDMVLIDEEMSLGTTLTLRLRGLAETDGKSKVKYRERLEWDRPLKRWVKRKQRVCIGRLSYVHPTSGERYYLRILLTKVRGAESYEDMFCAILLFSERDEVQVSLYNDDVEKYRDIMTQGKVYSISHLELMPLDSTYKYVLDQERLRFGRKTNILNIFDDCDEVPKYNFRFVDFATIPQYMDMKNSPRFVLEAVKGNMETIRLTLWEKIAHNQGGFLLHELNQDYVLGASLVSVGSYNGACLSTIGCSRLFIDPDIDETDDVHGWYADDGYVQKHINWTQTLANDIFQMEMLLNARRIKLHQYSPFPNVKYFRVLARTLDINSSEPLWYESCVGHSKRVDLWSQCDPSFSKPRLRVNVRIIDHTSAKRVTLFGKHAEMIIGLKVLDIKEFENHLNSDDIVVASVLRVRWEEEYNSTI
ncbi:replication protein A 70 kDa DNA-binding subunit D-like [Spinacia oleracea]|uniref:Replication protein A 70 kDa DNA-binding subunit D-like n=1 Tax=Spinacia oleracea TaxID=3562 RepID=A0ABM3RT05_SPIOL|nr:replication protein A 70 kDa DNA-binding subunit D-like [Spinacia oleracea]